MGLNVAGSVLESGGDVICIDQMDEPLPGLWCTSNNLHVSQRC